MRKLDWIALVFVAIAGVVMGALWLDVRAAAWSTPAATDWQPSSMPTKPTAITAIHFTVPDNVAAESSDSCCAHEGHATGGHAAAAPPEPEAVEPVTLDGCEADVEVAEQVDPIAEPSDPWTQLLQDEENQPEPIKVPVTLKNLDVPAVPTPPSPRQGEVLPAVASETVLPRFDPLKKPAPKANDDLDDPHGTVSTLTDLRQTMGSPVTSSKELFPDEKSRQEYTRGFHQQLREEERRAAASSLPPPPPAWYVSAPPPSESRERYAPPPLPPMADAPRQVDTLRDAASQLDDIANRLERRNIYVRADQLRAAAQELRLDARQASP